MQQESFPDIGQVLIIGFEGVEVSPRLRSLLTRFNLPASFFLPAISRARNRRTIAQGLSGVCVHSFIQVCRSRRRQG